LDRPVTDGSGLVEKARLAGPVRSEKIAPVPTLVHVTVTVFSKIGHDRD
jgi:hypothetical protein